MFDYLVVGQGIAGTVLTYTLLQAEKKVLVIDNLTQVSASQVAAGIYNPVTGMRLAKTWLADDIFPYLENFYAVMQNHLHSQFFKSCVVYRPYDSIAQQNTWIARTEHPDLKKYILNASESPVPEDFMFHELGGLETFFSGWVDVNRMLEECRKYFQARDCYEATVFDFQDLLLTDEKVSWKGLEAKKIIFCEGIYAAANPFFDFLPFKAVKGEILSLEIPETDLQVIVNQGVYLFQLPDKTFRAGATYDWDINNWQITDTARQTLASQLDKLLKKPYQIIGQQAGVRPATPDRKPFVGLHPVHKQIGIFNGLGTKGISLAPFLAAKFVAFLESGKELSKEVQIDRYFTFI
ncbi:MAG: FAD-binding oxidoreductase [Verrucomicrobia bacterium]|nr:FAD-binding oxidoreductase [Cytophagales bacterium]